MSSITRRRIRWIAAPVLAAASIALASPAFAQTWLGQNQPTVIQAAQGSAATLQWTYTNGGSSSQTPASGGIVTFNAPAGTTFPAQSTVPVAYAVGGTNFAPAPSIRLTGCSVGGGGATLSCNLGTSNGAAAIWNSGDGLRFSPQVTVDPAATPGTTSAAAAVQFTDPNSGINYTITNGTLDVNIVQSASTPMIDPMVGLGAGALVVGTGAAVVINRRRRASAGV